MISLLLSSWEGWLVIAASAFGIWSIARAIVLTVKRRRAPLPPVPEPRDLSHYHVRVALTDFLARHAIIGDADIRDGRVYGVVDPTRIDPLWRLFDNAAKQMAEAPNGINGDLYQAIKNQGQGTGWSYRCSGVSVSDIGEAARLMQAVAGRDQPGRE